MVGSIVGREESSRTDRAQLILVGAVAIAVVVLGLVVVFNTVLYTENVASTGSVSEPQEAQEMNQEVARNSKRLVKRVNAGPRWQVDEDNTADSGDVKDAVLANLSVYNTSVTNVTALNDNAFVSFKEGDTGTRKYAARIEDSDGAEFTSAGAALPDWSVTQDENTGVIVRDFDMIIETDSLATEGSGDEFHLIWNATDAETNYTVWAYEDSGTGDVVIRTLASGPGQDPKNFASGTECQLTGSASEDTVTLNISEGTIQEYPSCSADLNMDDGISADRFRTLDFFNGDQASGQYSMVVWRNDPDPGSYVSPDIQDPGPVPFVGPVSGVDSPYWSYGMWQLELTMTYDSRSTTFTDTYVVEVYNSTR